MASFRRYSIEVSQTAERQLRKLPAQDCSRLLTSIAGLSIDPKPRGCRKLRGYDDVFRIMVGTFRVIYSIKEAKIVVIILKVGHRRDVYR